MWSAAAHRHSLGPGEFAELRQGGDPAPRMGPFPLLVAAILLLHPRLALRATAHLAVAVDAEEPRIPLRLDFFLVARLGKVLHADSKVDCLRDLREEELNGLRAGCIAWHRDVDKCGIG